MTFFEGYAFLLLKVSWLSVLITRSRARALAAQGPAESIESVLDPRQAVEWPSLPALPTPLQLPRNSRFQGVLRSFRRVVHPLRRESPHSNAPRRDHPSSDLLLPIKQSVESFPPPPLQQLEENDLVSEHTTPRQPDSTRINGLPSAQSQRSLLPAGHIPPTPLDSLEDLWPSEPSSSSESEQSSLPSLQSESISNNSDHRNFSELDDVFDQPSDSEYVTIDGAPMSHQERADDSVTQICDAIRNMAVQENPRSKLVVSFPVFRGDESEDVFDFIDNFKRTATLNGRTNEDLAIGLPLYLKGHASAWFKSLGNLDGKTFDQLKALMIEHFASGARKIVRDEFRGLAQNSTGSRDELRQRRNFVGQTRGFRPRTPNRVCYNCGLKGHLHYYCNEKPDPRVPRQNNSRRGGNFDRQRSRFSGNLNFSND